MRVVRILIYEGTEEFVQRSLLRRSVKEIMETTEGSITEGFAHPHTPDSWDDKENIQPK